MMNEEDAHSGANPEPIAAADPESVAIAETETTADAGPGPLAAADPEPTAIADPQRLAIAPPEPVMPVGTLAILEAQLGEALKIMQDFSAWVHHPRSEITECVHVSRAVSELVTASATLAKIATQLQQGEPETRHRVIVEHAVPPAGGGVRRSRKRINHGGA